MTTTVIREWAERALARIAEYPKNHVPAARRGIVASADFEGEGSICFRRINGSISIEVWNNRAGKRLDSAMLPADLAQRAGEMLDSL